MKRMLTIVFLLTMNGCQEVQTFEVVGTWFMKDQSCEELPIEIKKSLGKLTISADGTFIANELPKREGGFYSGEYMVRWSTISGSGTWKFFSLSGRSQDLYLSFKNIDDQEVSYGFPLNISKKWSTIGLYYYLDDPDLGWKIEFEKSHNKSYKNHES